MAAGCRMEILLPSDSFTIGEEFGGIKSTGGFGVLTIGYQILEEENFTRIVTTDGCSDIIRGGTPTYFTL